MPVNERKDIVDFSPYNAFSSSILDFLGINSKKRTTSKKTSKSILSNRKSKASATNTNIKPDNTNLNTDIAGYINGIPVRKASQEEIDYKNRTGLFNKTLDDILADYNLYRKEESYIPTIDMPVFDLSGARDTVDKVLRYNKYVSELKAYTDLQKQLMKEKYNDEQIYNKIFAELLKSVSPYAYNLAYGTTTTNTKSGASSNANKITFSDKVKLATSIANALSKDSTGTVTPDVILNTIKSIIPEAFVNQPKKEQNKPISEEDLQKIIKVLED